MAKFGIASFLRDGDDMLEQIIVLDILPLKTVVKNYCHPGRVHRAL